MKRPDKSKLGEWVDRAIDKLKDLIVPAPQPVPIPIPVDGPRRRR